MSPRRALKQDACRRSQAAHRSEYSRVIACPRMSTQKSCNGSIGAERRNSSNLPAQDARRAFRCIPDGMPTANCGNERPRPFSGGRTILAFRRACARSSMSSFVAARRPVTAHGRQRAVACAPFEHRERPRVGVARCFLRRGRSPVGGGARSGTSTSVASSPAAAARWFVGPPSAVRPSSPAFSAPAILAELRGWRFLTIQCRH